jgi:predicted PurR-regulated permease PerM
MKKQQFINWSVESALRIGLIFLIVYISYLIFKPFLLLVVWGAIIAIAFYPMYKKIKKKLKGKGALASVVLILGLILILAIPAFFFVETIFEDGEKITNNVKQGTFHIPPPPENVKDWPVIGKPIYKFWSLSSTNITDAISQLGPVLKTVGKWLFNFVGSLAGSVVIFFMSILISGVFLYGSQKTYKFSILLSDKLVGKGGKHLVDNLIATVQSVVKGVIGVALIQSTLIGIGFWAADVPFAAGLTLFVFIFAIIQLPPAIIVFPVIIYVFSVDTLTVAIIFAIWQTFAGLSDNVLQPMLMGRGIETPVLVILIGTIGGMMLMGMVGLFVGAVVMALAYEIFTYWMKMDDEEPVSA